jgi:predicted dehydrogenase
LNTTKLNISICGFGRFIQKRILPVIIENNNLNLISIIKSSNTIASIDKCIYYNSLDEFLKNDPTGIIYIASPNYLHSIQTIKSLESGLNVICEKPMGITKIECDQMLETAYKKKLHLHIGHQLRFSPAIVKVKECIDRFYIGKIEKISIKFHYELPMNVRTWAYKKQISGGGCLMDAGIHAIDIISFISNKNNFKIVDLITDSHSHNDNMERKAICKFMNDDIECDININSQVLYSTNLIILGSLGKISVNNFTATWGSIDIEFKNKNTTEINVVDVSTTYANQLAYFINKINDSNLDYSYTEDAAKNVHFIENLYQFNN